jgi:hypothetical protein
MRPPPPPPHTHTPRLGPSRLGPLPLPGYDVLSRHSLTSPPPASPVPSSVPATSVVASPRVLLAPNTVRPASPAPLAAPAPMTSAAAGGSGGGSPGSSVSGGGGGGATTGAVAVGAASGAVAGSIAGGVGVSGSGSGAGGTPAVVPGGEGFGVPAPSAPAATSYVLWRPLVLHRCIRCAGPSTVFLPCSCHVGCLCVVTATTHHTLSHRPTTTLSPAVGFRGCCPRFSRTHASHVPPPGPVLGTAGFGSGYPQGFYPDAHGSPPLGPSALHTSPSLVPMPGVAIRSGDFSLGLSSHAAHGV